MTKKQKIQIAKEMRELCLELHDEAVGAVLIETEKFEANQPEACLLETKTDEIASLLMAMKATLNKIEGDPSDWSQVVKLKALCSAWLEVLWQGLDEEYQE